jgi:YD repeat-containing protein
MGIDVVARILQKTTMSYDKENRLSVFQEDAVTVTYGYDSDGQKRTENSGALTTIVWDGTDYLQTRGATVKTLRPWKDR